MQKKFNWAIVLAATLAFLVGLMVGWASWGYNVPEVEAEGRQPVCHVPPGNPDNAHTIYPDSDGYSGHFRDGKPHGKDYLGECEKPEPTPIPDKFDVTIERPEITCDTNYIVFGGSYRPDDKRSSIVFIINGRYPEVNYEEGKWQTSNALTLAPGDWKIRVELWGGERLLDSMDGKFTIDECEKPTPVPTPTPTPTPEEKHESSPPGAPDTCPNVPTPENPANFHLYRKGEYAELKWQPTDGDTVNIYWKNPSAGSWEHSLINSPNDGLEMIGGLGSYDWTFGLQQVNDNCNGSDIIEVEDGNTPDWVLFR